MSMTNADSIANHYQSLNPSCCMVFLPTMLFLRNMTVGVPTHLVSAILGGCLQSCPPCRPWCNSHSVSGPVLEACVGYGQQGCQALCHARLLLILLCHLCNQHSGNVSCYGGFLVTGRCKLLPFALGHTVYCKYIHFLQTAPFFTDYGLQRY